MLRISVFLLCLSLGLSGAVALAQEAAQDGAPVTEAVSAPMPEAAVEAEPAAEIKTQSEVAPEAEAAPDANPDVNPDAHSESMIVDGPKKNKVFEKIEQFSEGFNADNERHFKVLVGNYNLTQVVAMVRSDVGKAVQACGEDNPELKAPISTRYEAWMAAVDPVMTQAGERIDNMILAQDYATESDIRALFKFIDDDRAAVNAEMNKVPVTTKESCQFLLDKMDETQANMVQLLEATLVSLPMMIQDESQSKGETL